MARGWSIGRGVSALIRASLGSRALPCCASAAARRLRWRLPAATATTAISCRPEAMKELSPEMLALLEQKNMPKDLPILVRIFKEESELEVWKQDTTGRFQIAQGLSDLPLVGRSRAEGQYEGDRQAPEGFYTITPGADESEFQLLPRHQHRLPQRLRQSQRRHGAFLMIHGDCSSRGCYAMTDEQIGEIYSLAREVLPRRPEVVPDPGLSVPHDAGEYGAASQQPEHGRSGR